MLSEVVDKIIMREISTPDKCTEGVNGSDVKSVKHHNNEKGKLLFKLLSLHVCMHTFTSLIYSMNFRSWIRIIS